MTHKNLNDPVLYVAFLLKRWVTTPPTASTSTTTITNTTGSGSTAIGSENSSRIRLLHESGSMIGCTCQPSALSPSRPHLSAVSLLSLCAASYHLVRKCVIVKGEPLGRSTLILLSQKLSIRPPSRSQMHTCRERPLKHGSGCKNMRWSFYLVLFENEGIPGQTRQKDVRGWITSTVILKYFMDAAGLMKHASKTSGNEALFDFNSTLIGLFFRLQENKS